MAISTQACIHRCYVLLASSFHEVWLSTTRVGETLDTGPIAQTSCIRAKQTKSSERLKSDCIPESLINQLCDLPLSKTVFGNTLRCVLLRFLKLFRYDDHPPVYLIQPSRSSTPLVTNPTLQLAPPHRCTDPSATSAQPHPRNRRPPSSPSSAV